MQTRVLKESEVFDLVFLCTYKHSPCTRYDSDSLAEQVLLPLSISTIFPQPHLKSNVQTMRFFEALELSAFLLRVPAGQIHEGSLH